MKIFSVIGKKLAIWGIKLVYMFIFSLLIDFCLIWGASSAILYDNEVMAILSFIFILYIAIIHSKKIYYLTKNIMEIPTVMFFLSYLIFSWAIRLYSMDIYHYWLTLNDENAVTAISAYYLLFGIKLFWVLITVFLIYVLVFCAVIKFAPKIKDKIKKKKFDKIEDELTEIEDSSDGDIKDFEEDQNIDLDDIDDYI